MNLSLELSFSLRDHVEPQILIFLPLWSLITWIQFYYEIINFTLNFDYFTIKRHCQQECPNLESGRTQKKIVQGPLFSYTPLKNLLEDQVSGLFCREYKLSPICMKFFLSSRFALGPHSRSELSCWQRLLKVYKSI